MFSLRWTIPLLLAAVIIIVALGFVRYFNSYEAPGEHWAPASPVTHENARFTTNMEAAGAYHIRVEKLASKLPLLFVEYQPPGVILDTTIYSDDGIIRLDQRFADEGEYRISVKHTIHPDHHEVVDFTVQTPLFKYANDAALFLLLLLAGWISGRRLRQLSVQLPVVVLLLLVMGAGVPEDALAHGGHGVEAVLSVGSHDAELTLAWLKQPPKGFANNRPLDWSVRLHDTAQTVASIPFQLEIIHSESHFSVLTLSGVTHNGIIPLRYSPPDGTGYQLLLQAVVNGKVHHLALYAAVDPIRPTALRKWQSFGLMMVPLLLGMAWGWRTGGTVVIPC